MTFNLKDFPEAITGAHGIEVMHPDDFVIAQYDLDPIRALNTIKVLRNRLRHPPRSAEELVLTYERHGLPQMCKILSAAIDLI